jgi:hypothetical protein
VLSRGCSKKDTHALASAERDPVSGRFREIHYCGVVWTTAAGSWTSARSNAGHATVDHWIPRTAREMRDGPDEMKHAG